MKLATTTQGAVRSKSPLGDSVCTCRLSSAVCLACARWRRHFNIVKQRRRAWGAPK